jgi:hypothetical protein
LAHAPVFNCSYTLYDYQGVISDLIKNFKFDHRPCVVGDVIITDSSQNELASAILKNIDVMMLARSEIKLFLFELYCDIIKNASVRLKLIELASKFN